KRREEKPYTWRHGLLSGLVAENLSIMKKSPGFYFFVDDYLADLELEICSLGAQGLWVRCLCLMHKGVRRGYLQQANGTPLTLDQLARVAGVSTAEAGNLMQELLSAGVASATDTGIIYNRR